MYSKIWIRYYLEANFPGLQYIIFSCSSTYIWLLTPFTRRLPWRASKPSILCVVHSNWYIDKSLHIASVSLSRTHSQSHWYRCISLIRINRGWHLRQHACLQITLEIQYGLEPVCSILHLKPLHHTDQCTSVVSCSNVQIMQQCCHYRNEVSHIYCVYIITL